MITAADLYHVLTAVVPLYVAMILAYGSVKWWRIFTPDQCSGINRFVALFAVPLLSFHFISTNNPYAMNLRFIAADSLQKLAVLAALAAWSRLSARGSLEWSITLFSLSSLPNTLVMGIPLLRGMYGAASGSLMVQIVVLQCIIWYTLMLFLFEYRGARLLIMEQFPDTAGSIVSFRVDSDVLSLDGQGPLQADAELGGDGKLHVTVRKSSSSRSEIFSHRSHGLNSAGGVSATPRPSNLSNAEIYSLQSSRNPTPRGSSFNHTDFYSLVNGRNVASPRHSNFGGGVVAAVFDEESGKAVGGLSSPVIGAMKKTNGLELGGGGKDLHMFVWSSSASPVSEGGIPVFRGGGFANDHARVAHPTDHHHFHHQKDHQEAYEEFGLEDFSFKNKGVSQGINPLQKDGSSLSKLGSNSTAGLIHPESGADGSMKPASMPPTSVMTRLILIMVWRKLIRNPNTYSSLIGLIWSLVSFRWNVEMPAIIARSIAILSDAGLGMAMFSLGLFMALQPRIIACGNRVAAFSMAVRFITGPAVMAAASITVGLRGILLHIAIVQAALPQGIVPFVFAKEYNVHPDILSTGASFIVAYLMKSERRSLEDALNSLKQVSAVCPNKGFMKQLTLFEEMGFKVETSSPLYKSFRLKQLGHFMKIGEKLDCSIFRADPGLPPKSKASRELMRSLQQTAYCCAKCRRIVALEEHVISHVAGEGMDLHKQKGRGSNGQENECSSLFVEPLRWMTSVDEGSLEGKLLCVGCNARLGHFKWLGLQCSCGSLVAPAFQIQKSKVDPKSPLLQPAAILSIYRR